MKLQWIIIFCILIGSAVHSQTSLEQSNNVFSGEKFVTVQGLGINSLGEFKESWESASGFYLGYGIIYSDKGSLVFQTGYVNFKPNENAGLEDGSIFRMIPLMVGGRYYITMDRFRPFLLAMNGFNFIRQDWARADSALTTTSWQYNFQVGLGLDIFLFSNLQLELAAKYNSHLLDPPKPYNITGLEYSIGLVWRLSPARKD